MRHGVIFGTAECPCITVPILQPSFLRQVYEVDNVTRTRMISFLSRRRTAPQRVPTDQVVPVGFFDDTIIFRTFVLYTLFVFDDVLDVQKLHSSLERVVARPGWNKLGARLRRNVSSFNSRGNVSSALRQTDTSCSD